MVSVQGSFAYYIYATIMLFLVVPLSLKCLPLFFFFQYIDCKQIVFPYIYSLVVARGYWSQQDIVFCSLVS